MYTKIVTKRGFTPKVLNYQLCNIRGDISKISHIDMRELDTLEFYYITIEIGSTIGEVITKKNIKTLLNMYMTLFDNGYVYYDIHIDNIVFDVETGEVRIIDFDSMLRVEDEPPSYYPHRKLERQEYMDYVNVMLCSLFE